MPGRPYAAARRFGHDARLGRLTRTPDSDAGCRHGPPCGPGSAPECAGPGRPSDGRVHQPGFGSRGTEPRRAEGGGSSNEAQAGFKRGRPGPWPGTRPVRRTDGAERAAAARRAPAVRPCRPGRRGRQAGLRARRSTTRSNHPPGRTTRQRAATLPWPPCEALHDPVETTRPALQRAAESGPAPTLPWPPREALHDPVEVGGAGRRERLARLEAPEELVECRLRRRRRRSACLSVRPSVRLSVSPPPPPLSSPLAVSLSICLPIHPSIHPPIYTPSISWARGLLRPTRARKRERERERERGREGERERGGEDFCDPCPRRFRGKPQSHRRARGG